MPSYYPENNTPTPEDQPQRSLQKINSLLLGSGSGAWPWVSSSLFGSQSATPAGTTQTIDWASGNYFLLNAGSATGNITLTLTNPIAGFLYNIKVVQGATARSLVFPAGTTQPLVGGVTWAPSGINDTDVISLIYDGTNYQILGTAPEQG